MLNRKKLLKLLDYPPIFYSLKNIANYFDMLMKEDKGQTKIGKYLSTTHNKVRLKRPIIHDLSHSFVKKDNCRYRYSKNVDTCS